MFVYAWFSYFWIYFIYLNPVINYFKLEYNHNNSITEQIIYIHIVLPMCYINY